jgi:hypothetical protein
MGTWFNVQQAQLDRESLQHQSDLERQSRHQQIFTELLAQRERADSDLRSATFKTLFDHYFAKGPRANTAPNDASSEPEGSAMSPAAVRQQIMFLELLGRNFDTIDIKPLFESLDERLTRIIATGNTQAPSPAQIEAFRQRQTLRKVGRSLGGKQATALGSLIETKTQTIHIKTCTDVKILEAEIKAIAKLEAMEGWSAKMLPDKPVLVRAEKNSGVNVPIIDATFSDGKLRLSLDTPGRSEKADPPKPKPDPPKFSVGFYEAPYLDNTRLSSDVRLAVVLEKFDSPKRYFMFLDQIKDGPLREDYLRYKEDLSEDCEYAALRLILFPEGYMGLRDRPYVEEVLLKLQQEADDGDGG